ncbi:cellulose synthase subunit BcsC [compost metagenome]
MTPEMLLLLARQQAQQGHLQRAAAHYETCLQRHLPVHQEYAGMLYQHGLFQQAATILTQALKVSPQDPHLFFLRALSVLASGQNSAALDDMDCCIKLAPTRLVYLRQRATLFAQLDILDGALGDFQKIVQLAPDDDEALANCGIIHLRRNEYTQAVQLLTRHLDRNGDNAQVRRSLANAHRGLGNMDTALNLLSSLYAETPKSDAVQTDYALTLLADRNFDSSYQHYQEVVARSPSDQWALTGLYLSSYARGDAAMARKLINSELLVVTDDAGLLDRAALEANILAHPRLRWEPTGKSTTGGQQTTLLDLKSPPYAQLGELLQQRVQQIFHSMRTVDQGNAAHPWLRALPSQWKLQVWATVLHGQGGHQRPHIHPAGWISGVYYLNSGDGDRDDGNLIFGHPPDELKLPSPDGDFQHAPKTGQILFFPSFFLHHTTPYSGSVKRISIAFDAVPLP